MATDMREQKRQLSDRQTALIETNIAWLRQALSLLAVIGHDAYTSSPGDFAPHRVGSHLRHIVEFYECFLDAVESGHINYDARQRDESVEQSRSVAAGRILSIIQRLEAAPDLRGDSIIWVRMEDADAIQVQDCFLTSSIGRELQILSSHTIHHFALIAMTLRAHGVDVDPNFGMAPSSLRYQASKKDAEAA
jgi:hypothetical protein